MREPALPVPEVCAVIDAALPRPRIGVVTLMLPPAPVPLVLADIRPPVVSDKSFAMCKSTVPAFPDPMLREVITPLFVTANRSAFNIKFPPRPAFVAVEMPVASKPKGSAVPATPVTRTSLAVRLIWPALPVPLTADAATTPRLLIEIVSALMLMEPALPGLPLSRSARTNPPFSTCIVLAWT